MDEFMKKSLEEMLETKEESRIISSYEPATKGQKARIKASFRGDAANEFAKNLVKAYHTGQKMGEMGESLAKLYQTVSILIPFIESGKYEIPEDSVKFVFETKKIVEELMENNTEIPKKDIELMINNRIKGLEEMLSK